jgi:hypothetical protein
MKAELSHDNHIVGKSWVLAMDGCQLKIFLQYIDLIPRLLVKEYAAGWMPTNLDDKWAFLCQRQMFQ